MRNIPKLKINGEFDKIFLEIEHGNMVTITQGEAYERKLDYITMNKDEFNLAWPWLLKAYKLLNEADPLRGQTLGATCSCDGMCSCTYDQIKP